MSLSLHEKILQAYTNHVNEGWYPDIVQSRIVTNYESVSLKRAAVLCCIREDDCNGELYVLLTVRSEVVSTHIGEVCLPGGTVEPSDSSLYQTALREAEEEVNLKPHQVNFVGFLPPSIVGIKSTRQCYTAVVTLAVDVSELQLKANDEVDKIFWMPLKLFLGQGDHHWQKHRVLPFRYSFNFFQYESADGSVYVVWGFTAGLCTLVAVIVYGEPPHFPFSMYSSVGVDFKNARLKRLKFVYKKLRVPDSIIRPHDQILKSKL